MGNGEGGMGNGEECSMSNWEEGIDSFAGYPLVIEQRLMGVMAVFARHRFTEVTLQAIASIANGMALGIDRLWAEEELRKSEERWQLALKGNNDGIWDWNLKTHESFISLRNKQILGYEDQEMANPIHVDAWTSHIHPDDLGDAKMAMQDHLSHKTPYYSVEYRLRCKDGTYKWILSRGQALWDEQGQPVRMVGSITDISDRKWAEEKLRASEASLATAQRVAHVGSWEFDVVTQKFTWSEENFHIFGLDPTAPAPTYVQLIERVHPDDRGLWQTIFELVLAEGKPYKSDFRIVRPNGEIRYVEGRQEAVVNDCGQVIRLFGTNLDITQRKQVEDALRQSEAREREKAKELELTLRELKRTQAQLIHTEKMSSLGQMVAGVAHEINNPVSFIYCNITIARAYVQDLIRLIQIYRQTYPHPTPEIQELVEEIDLTFLVDDWQKLIASMEVGAERIHEIVRSLQIFSRQNESEVKLVDIHENIDNTLLILQHRLRCVGHRSEIQVIKNYGQLPKVNCYASQLNQVFMNLLSNAIDALEQELVSSKSCPLAAKPTITICTELKTQRQRLPAHLESLNSAVAVIRIADNGPGMTEEVLRQIFDPFFTTKPVGSGIGLGLSISHQIVVEKHGGQLSCISALGQGTEFIMEIPLKGQLS
ncbi:MAG TPA: hypothetical protein DC064_03600 [Cyanobacteria bacterium UBA9273]|nr:hypothetical protein [Cyanobacteria bacterium UBA9273]